MKIDKKKAICVIHMACLCLQDNPSSYEGVQWVFPKAPRNAIAIPSLSAMITFSILHCLPAPYGTLMHRYLYLHMIYFYAVIIGILSRHVKGLCPYRAIIERICARTLVSSKTMGTSGKIKIMR